MILARCPGSCGELIQGIIIGSEKLISYPINCYSYVKLFEGKRDNESKYPKAYRAVQEVFKYFNKDIDLSRKLKIEINSQIPIGKGMASSTADLGGTVLATSKYLGKDITEEEIAKICLRIEPTDSTIFSQLTLFDHLKGNYLKGYENKLSSKVLVLEGDSRVNTIKFREINRNKVLTKNISQLNRALDFVEEGIETGDLKKIGQGSIISSLANEEILKKPGLKDIIYNALKLGAYGVNTAHSGSVIGVLFEDKYFDKKTFINNIVQKSYIKNYISIKEYEIVKGGAEIVEMEV